MPDSAMRFLSASSDPYCDPRDLTAPIEADATLTAQLLRFVNSSNFGFRHEITSVQQALALLGVRALRGFVLYHAVFNAVRPPKTPGFSMTQFRADALRRAVFARRLAMVLGSPDSDCAFTAALLQDIAVPLLLHTLPGRYARLIKHREQGDAQLAEREFVELGWTHADGACLLFERWGLPDELTAIVRVHCDAEALLVAEEPDAGSVAVAVSSLLPVFGAESWASHERFAACWGRLPVASETPVGDFLNEIDEAFCSLAQALQVGAVTGSLAQLHATAETEATAAA